MVLVQFAFIIARGGYRIEMATYHVRENGREIGVMSGHQIKDRLVAGDFGIDTEIRKQGEATWHRMGGVASLRDVIRARSSRPSSSSAALPTIAIPPQQANAGGSPIFIQVMPSEGGKGASSSPPPSSTGPDKVILTRSPAMFRNHPVWFVLAIFFIPVFGIGLLWLFVWWLSAISTKLELTNRLVRLRRGILSKRTTEIRYTDVRNLQLDQSAIDRLFGVGTIRVSSAGQSDVEIEISGIAQPGKVIEIIRAR